MFKPFPGRLLRERPEGGIAWKEDKEDIEA
jgi:hypothetical protein